MSDRMFQEPTGPVPTHLRGNLGKGYADDTEDQRMRFYSSMCGKLYNYGSTRPYYINLS